MVHPQPVPFQPSVAITFPSAKNFCVLYKIIDHHNRLPDKNINQKKMTNGYFSKKSLDHGRLLGKTKMQYSDQAGGKIR